MATPLTAPDATALPHSFAALLDRDYERPEFLHRLKALIATAQERVRQEHVTGARGRNVVRHLTALVDDVVRTIWQYVTVHHPPLQGPCTLVALGGYGRGELNPFSDVDLMFLCQTTSSDKAVRETLYLLWDAGYSVGHSVRTRRDAVAMARSDLTAQTAMLEARLIDGDPTLFQWLRDDVCHRRFTQRRRRAFVRQKIAECRQRYAAFANTVNLMEPNIKESPGGLRDYHTTLWLSTAFYQVDALAALVDHGMLAAEEPEAVDTALDFLFRVRNALHYHYGRKHDLLSVDIQEQLASALGFEAIAQKRAVEHFLQTYYLHANMISQVCLTVMEAIEHTAQRRLWGLIRRPRPVGEGFVIRDGYLWYDPTELAPALVAQPVLLLQAFAAAQACHVPFAPAVSRTLKVHAALLATDAVRCSVAAKEVFFAILAQPQAAATLQAMHRHGVLSAYIPEFAALTCLASYDLYHRYTVDEHTLLTIERLESLTETQEPSLQPLAALYRQTADKALLKFALLLHDLGKDIDPGRPSHAHRSGELAALVCERLGLTAEQRHTVHILVVHHLAMNRLAQYRDITDEKVLAELASMVETVPNLEQLYVLTFADTSAVGPGVWTMWKGTLLAELYRRTLEYLVRQRPLIALTDTELSQRLRPMILEALGTSGSAADVDAFLDVMPARYLMTTSPGHIAVHIGLLYAAHQMPVALHAEQHLSAGFSSITICTAARRGVFSLIAGALSRNKLNILSAQIYTSSTGFALDTLQVETLERKPVTDPQVWRQVEADLCAALQDERHVAGLLTQRLSPRQERQLQVFAKPPSVVINNSGSDSHTIIEVQAQDRLGLLYRLTRLLYEYGLDIALAKISTEGNRAIDVFYVTDAVGHKLAIDTQIEAIHQALLETLSATTA